MTFIAARGTALLKLGLLYCIPFYGWIRERERWSESCILIGYPSGQDWPFLPSRDLPRIPVLVLLYLVSKGFLNVFLTSLVISFPFPNFSCYCFPCSFEEFWTGLLNYSDGISEVVWLISHFCHLKEFISKKGYPQWTQVTRVVEGGETPIFKQFFSGWRDEGEQVGLGKVFRQGHLGEFIPLPYMLFIFTVDTVFILSEQRTKVNTRKEQKQKRRRLCWYNFTVNSLKILLGAG